jgi:NADH:ubiquinone oxidoreductase subunit 6 (subunit J)
MPVTALQAVFFVGAFVILGASLMVVTSRNLFHSAIWLIVALFGVAVLFVLLDAGFLAASQVVVYIGAIATLIIFAVMLTRRVMQSSPEAANEEWWLAAAVTLLLFVLLAAPLAPFFPGMLWRVQSPDWAMAQPTGADASASLVSLGQQLVSAGDTTGYAVPFELASLLLLGAMIGSIVIAREKR